MVTLRTGNPRKQVDQRRAEVRKEAANEELETALSTRENVEELWKLCQAGWRKEQDAELLRARIVRVYQEDLARVQRKLERARATKDKAALRDMGLQAARMADKATLCAMAVQAAAQDGADVNTRAVAAAGDKPPERWLWIAADGLVETLRALVAAGADANHANNTVETALTKAAQSGNLVLIQALLEAGAAVNHADNHGRTALTVAASCRDVPVIQALLEAGADVDHADQDGDTALIVAASYNNVPLILAAGADVEIEDHDGETALTLAAYHRNAEAITLRCISQHYTAVAAENRLEITL